MQKRSTIRSRLYAFVVIGTIVFSLFTFLNFNSTEKQPANALDKKTIVKELHERVNEERKKEKLTELSWNEELAAAAEAKTQDMIKNNYFAHISPVDGKKWSEFILEAGYDYKEAGENLAVGYTDPKIAVEAWMNSPTHKENILSPGFEETGMGLSVGNWKGSTTYFIAQEFGRK